MKLNEIIDSRKARILKHWVQYLIDTYPPESSKFLNSDKDRFSNPIGSTIVTETGLILEDLVAGKTPDQMGPSLERIVRLRAVQDFAPSEAVGFVFLLRKAIREALSPEEREALGQELIETDERIEAIALKAFDLYLECVRGLYEIRVTEEKKKMYMLLKRANMVV